MESKPLPLDSTRWADLTHAFGAAADTPGLLRRLTTRDEHALGQLYGSVFHQTSVYPASIAALPHLDAAGTRLAAGHFSSSEALKWQFDGKSRWVDEQLTSQQNRGWRAPS